jgi:hypothetical protein
MVSNGNKLRREKEKKKKEKKKKLKIKFQFIGNFKSHIIFKMTSKEF